MEIFFIDSSAHRFTEAKVKLLYQEIYRFPDKAGIVADQTVNIQVEHPNVTHNQLYL